MGLLTNYFAATPAELDALAVEDGPLSTAPEPSSRSKPSNGWFGRFRSKPQPPPAAVAEPTQDGPFLPAFASSGIDGPRIALLDSLLTGVRFLDEDWDGADMPTVKDGGDQGPWVFALRPEFREAVSRIDDGTTHVLAARWASNTDWMGDTDPDSVRALHEFIGDLRALANAAVASERDLYVWVSL